MQDTELKELNKKVLLIVKKRAMRWKEVSKEIGLTVDTLRKLREGGKMFLYTIGMIEQWIEKWEHVLDQKDKLFKSTAGE